MVDQQPFASRVDFTRVQSDKVPDEYRRRQTRKNAERYITPELKTFEDKALSAQDRALAREKLLYEKLLDDLAPHIPALQRAAAALAELDLLATLSSRAAALDWSAPLFTDDAVIEIEGGLVSDILTDESNGDIEVYVMDHDVEGGDEDRCLHRLVSQVRRFIVPPGRWPSRGFANS